MQTYNLENKEKKIKTKTFMVVNFSFLLLFSIFLISFSSATLQIGIDGTSDEIGVNFISESQINYSTLNVNNSQYLQGYTPTTLKDWIELAFNSVYCELTGCTMSGDIDMGTNDIINVNDITIDNDLEVGDDVDIGGDLNVTGNLIADGSHLQNVNYTETDPLAYNGTLAYNNSVVHLLYNETIDGRKTFTDTIICENNMIKNGDFATDSDWTLGGTATISGGKGNFGSNTATFTQDIGVEVGKKYIVTFTLSSLAGGPLPPPYVYFTLGGVTGSVRGAGGTNTYTQEITAINTNPLVFQAGGPLTGASIDDVSVIGYGIEVEGRAEINYLDVKKELLVEGTDNSRKLTVLDSDNKNMFNVNTSGRTIKMGDTDYITFSESGRGALNLESGGFAAFTGTRVGYPNTGLGYLNEKMMFSADVTLENYIGLWTPENAGYHVFEWGSFNNGNPTAPLLFINAGSGSAFSASIGYTLEKDQFTLYPDGSYHQYGAPRIYYDGLHEVESYYLAGISNTHEFGYKVTAGTNTGITSAFEVGDGTITNALDCNDKNIVDVKDININGDTVLGIDSSDTITFNAKSASDLDMGGYDLENIGNINATKNITSTNILPQITDTYSIGSSLLKWLNGYFINLFVTNATIENLNVTGTLTTGISHMHGLVTEIQTVSTIDTWYNVTFNSSLGDTYNIDFEDNRTLVISHDGHYTINFGCGIMDDSPSPNANVGMRITNNGAEVSGSYVEVDTTKQNADLWIEHTTHSEFSLGDELNMQYIASDTDVTMEQEDTYALQGFNCYGYLQEVIL